MALQFANNALKFIPVYLVDMWNLLDQSRSEFHDPGLWKLGGARVNWKKKKKRERGTNLHLRLTVY